jgi:hypothetical protein
VTTKLVLLVGTIIGTLFGGPDPALSTSVSFQGDIDYRNYRWHLFVERMTNNPTEVTDLTINSRGGDYLLGAYAARHVAQKEIVVYVPEYCEGACLPICLAAPKCLVGHDAKITFEPAKFQRKPSEELLKEYVKVLTEAGLPDAYIEMTLNPKMPKRELTPEELTTLGIVRKP